MHKSGTGVARGGSFFMRRLVQLTRRLQLSAIHPIQTREGSVLHVDLTDERVICVLDEALSDGNQEANLIRAALHEGDTFIDIGANHGTYSLLAARLVGPQGTVVAIEPQPRKAELIERSLQTSDFHKGKVVVQAACGAEEGQVDLFVPQNSGGAGVHESFSGTPSHERMTVPMVTLDRLDLPLEGSVFIKLDVEGSELATLQGASSLLRNRRPLIMLELHPGSAAAAGSSIDELLVFLEGHGYEFSEVEHFPEIVDRTQIDKTARRNVVGIPADKQQHAR